MIEESYVNIEAILKQFDARERCIYLPPRDEKVFAYVPLSNDHTPEEAWRSLESPINTVTIAGDKPGLMIFLPISYNMLTSIEDNTNAEVALKTILVDQTEILGSIKESESENRIQVIMSGSKFKIENPIIKSVFGSIPTSIAGCILSYIYNKPLVFIKEDLTGKVTTATFEIPIKN